MTTGWRGPRALGPCMLLLALWSFAGPAPAWADLFGRTQDEEATAAPDTSSESKPDPSLDAADSLDAGQPAFAAEELVAALPRLWHGTFAWDGGVAYFVEAEIVSLSVRPNGEVSFTADTIWMPDGLRARMSGRVDPATLQVRIWEVAEDESAENFESDGRYDGSFAADLWDLRARWETDGTGETGSLVLIAEAQPATSD